MLWNHGLSYWLVLPVLLFFVPIASAQISSPFTVGLVEANGNLVPVAAFDGEGWSNPWPVDLALDTNTPSWPNLPEVWNRGSGSLKDWTLWLENPGPPFGDSRRKWHDWTARLSSGRTALAISGLVESEPLCSKNLALITDAGDRSSSLIQCTSCCPNPKRGIATTSESPPELVERLGPEDEDAVNAATGVRNSFDAIEDQEVERLVSSFGSPGTIDGQLRYFGHWLSADRRHGIPLHVSKAFRIQLVDAAIYYLEINRDYPSPPEDEDVGCSGRSYLRTWVLANIRGELVSLLQDLLLTDCDMKGVSFDSPLVFWRHTPSIDLLVQRHGWESEDYLILTIDNRAVTERTRMRFRRWREYP